MRKSFFAVASLLTLALGSAASTADDELSRGQYLATIMDCAGCHTTGVFLGKPDPERYLAGSEVGFQIPGLGIFYPPNLTPDKETGIGNWTDKQVIEAIQQGKRPDNRMLAPIMPYHAFANLTPQDAQAIVAFLRTIPPIKNKVPGPFGPNDKPTEFVMKVVPGEGKK